MKCAQWLAIGAIFAGHATAQTTAPKPPVEASDSVTVRINGVDLRSAIQLVQPYVDRPIIFAGSATGGGGLVTLETPAPVPRRDVVRLLRGLLDAQGYELVDDSVSGAYRATPRDVRSLASAPIAPVAGVPSTIGGPPRIVGAPEMFVISLKHARAADVAATINTLFGRTTSNGGTNAGMGSRSPTLADALRGMQVPPPAESQPSQAQPSPGGRTATLTGELTIVPDARSNNLLIRANRADFDLVRDAIEQIDVRPPQVLIEVLIVEARNARAFSLGIEAALAQHPVDHSTNTTLGGEYTLPTSTGLADLTLRIMGIGSWDVDATIHAAATRGDARIVSRPVVLTANDEQAEMVVGSQRPFVQVSRSLPTDAVVRDQVVQYRDVGTKLSVRPTISVDGTVALSVTQEVSNATNETAFNAPVISTRSVKTELLARDAQTIVLGGLTDHQRDIQTRGIPILSRIPLLGGLFGSQERATSETELFVFLTPYVIRSDEDLERLTAPMRRRAEAIRP